MHKLIIIALLITLSIQSKKILLQQKEIYIKDKDQDQYVDTVLYSTVQLQEVGATKATIEQTAIFDTLAVKNYVITKDTQYGKVATPNNLEILYPGGIDCSGYCTGDGSKPVADLQTALGGKAQLKDGSELPKSIQVQDFSSSKLNLYFPKQALSYQDQYYQILKDIAHFGFGVAFDKTVQNIFDQAKANEELVENNQFSIYAHNDIAQIVVGNPENYFIQPNSQPRQMKISQWQNQQGWAIDIVGLRQNEKDIDLKGTSLKAYFDSTTKYIYVPYVKEDPARRIPFYSYFMSAFVKCFKTTSSQRYSFKCPKDQFRWEDYENISFITNDVNGQKLTFTLTPQDYIEERPEGYELLFAFSEAPQKKDTIYLGTTFMNKYYTVFDQTNGQVTVHDKFHVDTSVGGKSLDNRWRIPFIVCGCLLALAAIIALLVILKRIKMPDVPFVSTNVIPAYQRGGYQQQQPQQQQVYELAGNSVLGQQNDQVKRSVFNNQDIRQSNRPVQNLQYVTQSPIQRYQQF